MRVRIWYSLDCCLSGVSFVGGVGFDFIFVCCGVLVLLGCVLVMGVFMCLVVFIFDDIVYLVVNCVVDDYVWGVVVVFLLVL